MTEQERLHAEEKEIEREGAAWAQRSDEFLVGYVSQNRQSQFHTPAIVEGQRRLARAIQTSGDCASTQTAQVLKLTDTLKALTWVLVGVGLVQVAVGLVQVWAMLRGGA